MPLQIRRGLNAERTQITPANGLVEGELLYTTDEKKLYIGTGSTGEHQGVVITGYTNNDAKDAAAQSLTTGEHVGIGFTYDSGTKKLNATVDLSAFDGPIVADALKGSVFADDSGVLLDAIDKVLYGNVVGNVSGIVTGNLSGNVVGNVVGVLEGTVIGNVEGDVTGSIFADDSTMLVDGTNGRIVGPVFANVTGDVTGNVTGSVTGSVTGDVKGSVFGDDSTKIVDAVENSVYAAGGFFGSLIVDGVNNLVVGDGSVSIEIDGLTPDLGLRIVTNIGIDAGGDIFRILSHHDETDPSELTFLRTRGSNSSQLSINAGDQLFAWKFFGRGTSDIGESSTMRFSSDPNGTIGSDIVPGKIEFQTTNNAGVTATKLSIDKDGLIGVASNTLIAGAGAGEVDISAVATYLKINVGGTDYALPLYAINTV